MADPKPLIPWIQALSDRAENGDFKAIAALCDALDTEVRARGREQGGWGKWRNAVATARVYLREVFPELSLNSAPWTVAAYVKTLVEKYQEEKCKRQSVEATVEFARALETLRKVKVTQ